ncbi:MAG: ATPase central domain protein [Phycisphaerales bacterium]|nr:ATPase central domain protein [Phycisphaerales bacterium]
MSQTDRDKLERLLANRVPVVSVRTFEEGYVLDLARQVTADAGWDLWVWTVTAGLRDGLVGTPPLPDTDHPAAALYHLAGRIRGRAGDRPTLYVLLDAAGHLKDERTLRAMREAVDAAAASMAPPPGGNVPADARPRHPRGHLLLVDHAGELPPVVAAAAEALAVSLPDTDELELIVRGTVRELAAERTVTVQLSRRELDVIVRNLRGLTRRQAKQIVVECVRDDDRFDAADINRVLAAKRRLVGDGLLDYVEAPVDMAEIGGLKALKRWLDRRRGASDDKAIAFGLQPARGILLLGVQGAGKSLAAKAVATAWHWPLLRLDAGSLYDRFIGESERRLRDALTQVERMAPVVLWLDEVEKGFASAASQSSDGGLSKRMFGTLLTWMQERTCPVFLVATANDIEALPPELLRKGRFDEIFFVDLPDLEARSAILAIHLAKRKRDPAKFDLAALAEAAAGFSGAELEQAVVAALHDAFAAGGELTTAGVLAAVKASPPLSVTMAERIDELRAWAKGRCVPAE